MPTGASKPPFTDLRSPIDRACTELSLWGVLLIMKLNYLRHELESLMTS